jgi:hypothetical protein
MSREVHLGEAILDGVNVESISSLLTSTTQNLTRPNKLIRRKLAFKGSDFLGDGFLISTAEAEDLLKKSPIESEVLKPFLNAQDLNTVPSRIGPRWIVDMRERSENDARKFKLCWRIIEENVKPERLKKDAAKYPKMVEQWWQHWNSRPELYEKLASVEIVIAIPIVSKYQVAAIVGTSQVFGAALVVCPVDSYGFFAILSSWMHRSWAEWWGSKMRNDFRYSISDCFDSFPLCAASVSLENLGRDLDLLQRKIADNRNIGLTKIYGFVNSENSQDADIIQLRELHEKIDREVARAFGFDIEIGEYELAEFQGLLQWGPPSSQRIEILQLLLAENQRQHDEGAIEWPTK